MSNKKYIKDVSNVKKVEDKIVIEVIDNSVNPESVKEIVDNCKNGKCDCMSKEAKEKVEFINFVNDGKNIAIEIKGDLTPEEVKEAMKKSKKELYI